MKGSKIKKMCIVYFTLVDKSSHFCICPLKYSFKIKKFKLCHNKPSQMSLHLQQQYWEGCNTLVICLQSFQYLKLYAFVFLPLTQQ